MKKVLLPILCLFIYTCDSDSPNAPLDLDLCGVAGGDDINEDGYHCGDIQVLQDIIDVNEILSGQNLLEIGYQLWDNGRIIEFGMNHTGVASLPESFGNLSNLINLNLNGCSINQLPNTIIQLSNLTTLYINSNGLSSVPNDIGNLINLTNIDFGANSIDMLPESIYDLINLTALNFPGNQITYLSSDIENLIDLTYIDLSSNLLPNIPISLCVINPSVIWLTENNLCEEYHYECITEQQWGTQDQTNCP